MKHGVQLAALSGVVAGALALSACGSDDNTKSASSSPPAANSIECGKGAINAAGSSAQKNAIEQWIKDYAAACSGAQVNYNASGSGSGIQSFVDNKVAFAGSDSALKEDEPAKAKKRCGGNEAWHLPMVIGPVAVMYNVKGVDNLQLSPKTIAGMFSGKITKWNDPQVAKDNPDAKLPDTPVKPVYRADESGTTDNFTDFLGSTAPDVWTWEAEKKWPAQAAGQGAPKSDGVTTTVKQTTGGITYAEMSYAENSDLKSAKIANGSGEFVELSADSASKALEGAKIKGSGNDLVMEIDYATKTQGAYPIVLVTYEIACSKGLSADQSAAVKAFLNYTASADGQKSLTDVGYAPLPASVKTKVETAVKALS